MKRFLCKLSLLLPLPAVMVWVNWSVDPAMVVEEHRIDPSRHRYESIIAGDLLAGRPHRYVAPSSGFIVDEQIFRSRPQIDSLVLGSSIGTPIHAGLFGGPEFFNTSMFGARIDEMVAIHQLAIERGLHLRHVLIEIDARALGKRPPIDFPQLLARARNRLHVPEEGRRPVVWSEVWHALRSTGDWSGPVGTGAFDPYDTLLSPRYFQFSLPYLVQRWTSRDAGQQKVIDQFGKPNQILVFPDGSVEWCDNFLIETPQSMRLKFDKVHVASFAAEEYRPTADKCRLCEAFVSDLRRSGVEVEFVLLPPNPWFYDRAVEEWKRAGKPLPAVETEAYIRSLAAKYGIPARGSLDPRRLGVKEEDYVDDVHLRRDSIDRLFKAWKTNG